MRVKSFEEECIRRYFLDPGSAGPIESVYVADEDLLEIFSVNDSAAARQSLLHSLPNTSVLRARFAGEFRPIPGKAPDYVHILVFLCWMQTTKTRMKGDRDFRELLEKQIGDKFLGASMSGLNPMWEHLRDFLEKEHAIELILPEIHPHRQIGRTLRLAFPTWRDRAAFRKLRQALPDHLLLDPLHVSNRIRTSRRLIGETMPAFEYNFKKFDDARKRGSREYMGTPFWQAWYTIVAEHAALEHMELTENDFGELNLFRVSPLGDRVAIFAPDEGRRYVCKALATEIRNGVVYMESLGFGRYKATGRGVSNVVLMERSKVAEFKPDQMRSVMALNRHWVLVNFKVKVDLGVSQSSTPREFGWRDGIRVSGAYLGRTPLTPILTCPISQAIRVENNGHILAMDQGPDGLLLPHGSYDGKVKATWLKETREVLLVSCANEVGDVRRLNFDNTRELSEDEFHHDTVPALDRSVEPFDGARHAPCHELVTLAEALYERSARGLSFSEAVDIVRRCLPGEGGPSVWDIIRSLADAGWIELTLLRHYPARRILQRPLTAEPVGHDLVRISGPTPIAVVQRIQAAAGAAHGSVETWNGTSDWALPRYVVRVPDERARQDFICRLGVRQPPAPRLASMADANTDGVHGYKIIGRLDEWNGFFAVFFDPSAETGLFRYEREGSLNPFLYRSVVASGEPWNFVSPSAAILAHYLRGRGKLFAHKAGGLRPLRPRVFLPSSWARWMSDRTLCNPAPKLIEGGWQYHYPVGTASLKAISRLVPVAKEGGDTTPWMNSFLASASNRGRTIHDGRLGAVRCAQAGRR